VQARGTQVTPLPGDHRPGSVAVVCETNLLLP